MSTLLIRSAEDLAIADREREDRDADLNDLVIKAGWRNLLLSLQMGVDERPLAGALLTRINGVRRAAAAFIGPDAPKEDAP